MDNPGNADKHDQLNAVEREVLLLFAEGHSHTAIATNLSLSVRDVEAHHASLTRKLGLPSDTELVRQVLRQRVLSEK